MVVARAAIGLIMVAAYILNHHPARGGIRDLLRTATGRSFDGPAFVPAETLAYFFSTLAIALRCDDLGELCLGRRYRACGERCTPTQASEQASLASNPCQRLQAASLNSWAGPAGPFSYS